MRRLIAVSSLALGALVLAPTAADAWNKPGHMVTAAIAFQELRQRDPQTLAAVLDLLRRHPHHGIWLDSLATDPTATPADQDAFVFMYAARWADDVRDSASLHCERCHFINFPFKPAGQPASVPTFPPREENVIFAFDRNLNILRTSSDTSERAKALTWIFHLVGDVHQPLHTTSLYSTDYRERDGDRGGNSFFVREQPTFEPTRLHSFWDGLVLKGASAFRFRTVQDRAASLRGTFTRDTFPELSEHRFAQWANPESFDLAVRQGYLSGALDGSTEAQANANPGQVPLLPSGYVTDSRTVAEKRATLAGYRLAETLSLLF